MKFQLFGIIFCLLLSKQGVFGQQKAKDSLWQAWQNEKLADSLRLQAVNTYVKDYLYNDAPKTIRVSQELIAYAEKIENYATVAQGYNMLSRGYYFQGNSKESFEHLKASIDYSNKANDIEQALLSQLNLVSFFSDSHLQLSEYQAILREVDSLASVHHLWSIAADAKYTTIVKSQGNDNYEAVLRKLGELELLLNDPSITVDHEGGRLFYSLASGYRTIGKYKKAKAYYTRSIEESNKLKPGSNIIRYIYRGEVNLILGDTLAAVQDYKQAFEVAFRSDNTLLALTEGNYAKGLYEYYTGNYKEAYPLFDRVLSYNKESNRLTSISYSHLFMARITLHNKEYNKALALSTEGLSYARDNTTHVEHQLEFLNNLYTIYKHQDNASQALVYFEQYKALYETIFNEEKTRTIAIQDAENKFAVERQEIAFQHEVALKEERQQHRLLMGSGASLLGLAGLGFLVYTNRRKRKASQREQQLQEDFTQQLLQNTEEERSRIAGDLHDSVNHQLLHLKQKVQFGKVIKDEELTTVIEQVRSISHNLSPALFDQVGLVKSIEALCNNIMEVHPLRISTQLDYKETLTKKQELQIYRITEEALNNILKHSNATHAIIHIQNQTSVLEVKIKDNGVGFQQDLSDRKAFHFGLTNMKQRAKSLKGTLDFKSNDTGTALNLIMTT